MLSRRVASIVKILVSRQFILFGNIRNTFVRVALQAAIGIIVFSLCFTLISLFWTLPSILKTSRIKGEGEYHLVIKGKDGFLFYGQEITAIARKWPEQTAKVKALKEYLDSLGVDLIVVPLPMKIELYGGKLNKGLENYTCEKRYEFFRRLHRDGIKTIDVLPDLRLRSKETLVWLREDTHWNQEGIIIAARVIANSLGHYTLGTSSLFMTRDSTLRHLGDLQNILGSKDSIKLKIKQVVRKDGSPYEDDDKSPIMILGDSYVAFPHINGSHLTAHIAYNLKQSVCSRYIIDCSITGCRWLRKMPKKFLSTKRVVVWVFTSRTMDLPFQ